MKNLDRRNTKFGQVLFKYLTTVYRMTNKKKLETLKINYIKIPKQLYNKSLSLPSIALYGLLASFPEEFNPSISFLSKKLDSSRTSIIKYLEELCINNIIQKTQQGNVFNLSKYKFINPKEWK